MRRNKKLIPKTPKINQSYPSEPIEVKMRMLKTSGINDLTRITPPIYNEEYQEAYDIRADKWEIAQSVSDAVEKAKAAKGETKPGIEDTTNSTKPNE